MEYGEWRSNAQGRRTDIHEAVDLLKQGGSNLDLIEHTPVAFVKYHRGLDKVAFHLNKVRGKKQRDVKLTVLIGPSGCGKTSSAYELDPDLYKLDTDHNNALWFDGYEGEKTLLIDDFEGWISFRTLLNITDRYPYRAPIKGGFTWALWTHVIITSNLPVEHWYMQQDISPLQRRINLIKNFFELNKWEDTTEEIDFHRRDRDWETLIVTGKHG